MEHAHSNAPIRIFKSDFMESFTHVHPWQVLVVWLTASVTFLAIGFYQFATSSGVSQVAMWITTLLMLPLGVVIWTLSEYSIHRFIFHFKAKSNFGKKFVYFAHGVHHAQPRTKTRLLMPLAVSIPLGMLYFFLISQFPGLTAYQSMVLMGALCASYLSYDMMHWAQHHSKSKNPYLLKMRRYHMRHHVQHSDTLRFGISQDWWDRAFGTYPHEEQPRAEKS